jgi:hypothetical protein
MTIVPIASRFCFSGATDTHQDSRRSMPLAQAKTDCGRPKPAPHQNIENNPMQSRNGGRR